MVGLIEKSDNNFISCPEIVLSKIQVNTQNQAEIILKHSLQAANLKGQATAYSKDVQKNACLKLAQFCSKYVKNIDSCVSISFIGSNIHKCIFHSRLGLNAFMPGQI